MYTGPEVIERYETSRGPLQLQRRGDHFEIISNGVFLMATYNGESERLLVTAALDAAAIPRRVLVGGLGVGFSLGAALADPRVEQVTVVEIEEPLIEWNRSYLAPFSGHGLASTRTRVVNADLVAWLSQCGESFDAVCLDIDNGPDWTVTDANGSLYSETGLKNLGRIVAAGGVIAFWSAFRSPAFVERLGQFFDRVEELPVDQERGEPDYVFLARKRG